ncbi:MAG: ABC transporter family substrate-binding protein [Actinomycetales bacterium]|nr:ABC transporter family substrate-binding protein [Actinomycetales bacterium]
MSTVLAVAAASAVVLTGCTSGSDKDEEGAKPSASTQPITITYAYEQEFQAYNPNTADQNASLNAVPLQQVLRGFWYYGPDGSVQPDTEFGTYEKVSDNPLTVKYTFNQKAVWSDGEPIDCDDAVLGWAANNGKYKTGKKDSEGNDIAVFSSAGTVGYEDADKPQCADGEKTFTLVYTKPFADWVALFGGGSMMPAHIVEKESGVPDIIAAVDGDDQAALKKAGEFYNTAWVYKKGELKPEISPSSGTYQLSAWQAGQSLTLKANPKWWGTPPNAETIVIRFIKQDQQAQALQNGEIQAMDPQPNAELLKQLEGIGDSIKVTTGDQFTYEHLDFNLRNNSPFKDRDLREAFTKCLPRQQIVDNLIKPQNPKAQIQNSRYVFTFQSNYKKVADAIVGTKHDALDVEGAKSILESKGKAGMTVRIAYQTPNPRRTSQVDLIRDSCGQAGFKIVDAGSESFFADGLFNGKFDIAMFAWAGSPLVTGSSSTYTTNGGNNFGKYTSPTVDDLISKLNAELNKDKQEELIIQVEKALWEDLATIPVYAFPGILATVSNGENFVYNASQAGLMWNSNKWGLAAK